MRAQQDKRYDRINRKIRQWIAEQFGTNQHRIYEIIRRQNATLFLLVWPIMEQEIFNGFMKLRRVDGVASKMAPFYSEMHIESIVWHFYSRYHGTGVLENDPYTQIPQEQIGYTQKCFDTINEIVINDYESISEEDKIRLLMSVIYLYRNNIFHGNKRLGNWGFYEEEIYDCIEFMMSLVSVYKTHFPNINGCFE